MRAARWGPRTLDADVLWIDGVTLEDPDLTVPHPRWRERRFVLAPLAELAPDLVAEADLAASGGAGRRGGYTVSRTTRFSDANGTHRGRNVPKGSRDHIPNRRAGPGRPVPHGSARRRPRVRVAGRARSERLDPRCRPAASTCWSSPPLTTPSPGWRRMVAPVATTAVVHLSGSLGLDVLGRPPAARIAPPARAAAQPVHRGGTADLGDHLRRGRRPHRRPDGRGTGRTDGRGRGPGPRHLPRRRLHRRQPPGGPHRPGRAGGRHRRAAARRLRRPPARGHRRRLGARTRAGP